MGNQDVPHFDFTWQYSKRLDDNCFNSLSLSTGDNFAWHRHRKTNWQLAHAPCPSSPTPALLFFRVWHSKSSEK